MKPLKFNPRLWPAESMLSYVETCLATLEAAEKRQRTRKAEAFAEFNRAGAVLICNLLVARIEANLPLHIHVDRNRVGQGQVAVMHAMQKLGWIEVTTETRIFKGKFTTLSIATVRDMPLPEKLDYLLQAEYPIVLKSWPDARGRTKQLPITPTDNAYFHMAEQVRQLNAYLHSLPITYALGDAWTDDSYVYAERHRIADRSLRRVFIRGSLASHGRLYGGFWMNMPKHQRGYLKINGEAVCAVDFREAQLRIAYAQAGSTFPYPADGTAYIAGPYGKRSDWKTVTNAMLAVDHPLRHLPLEGADYREAFWPHTAAEVFAAIQQRHAPLQGMWWTGIAHTLTKIEADCIIACCLSAAALGLHVLPLHDCLLCPVSEAGPIAQLMEHVSHTVVGLRIPTEKD